MNLLSDSHILKFDYIKWESTCRSIFEFIKGHLQNNINLKYSNCRFLGFSLVSPARLWGVSELTWPWISLLSTQCFVQWWLHRRCSMMVHCREALPAPECLTCSLRMEERVLSVGMGALSSLFKFFFSSQTFLYHNFLLPSSFSICIYSYVHTYTYTLHTVCSRCPRESLCF